MGEEGGEGDRTVCGVKGPLCEIEPLPHTMA